MARKLAAAAALALTFCHGIARRGAHCLAGHGHRHQQRRYGRRRRHDGTPRRHRRQDSVRRSHRGPAARARCGDGSAAVEGSAAPHQRERGDHGTRRGRRSRLRDGCGEAVHVLVRRLGRARLRRVQRNPGGEHRDDGPQARWQRTSTAVGWTSVRGGPHRADDGTPLTVCARTTPRPGPALGPRPGAFFLGTPSSCARRARSSAAGTRQTPRVRALDARHREIVSESTGAVARLSVGFATATDRLFVAGASAGKTGYRAARYDAPPPVAEWQVTFRCVLPVRGSILEVALAASEDALYVGTTRGARSVRISLRTTPRPATLAGASTGPAPHGA